MTTEEKSKPRRALWKLAGKIAGGLLLLAMIVHTILVVSTASGVRKAKEAMQAKGYPMTVAEVLPQPLPDDQNAAVELNKVFGLMAPAGNNPNSPGDSTRELGAPYKQLVGTWTNQEHETPYTDEQLQDLAKTFATTEVGLTFELLSKAAGKPGCYLPMEYENGPAIDASDLSRYRDACKLLAVRAKYEAQTGNKEAALQRIRESLALGNLLSKSPFVVSQYVRLSCLDVSLQALRLVSARQELSTEEIASTLRLTQPYRDPKPLLLGLNGERLIFGQWYFESNASEDAARGEAFTEEDGEAFLISMYRSYLGRPFFNADYSNYLHAMRICNEDLEGDLKTALSATTKQRIMNERSRLGILSGLLVPDLSGVRIKLASSKAAIDLTELAVACNQYRLKHGAFPESLDEAGPVRIDEATGAPYVYQKTDKGAWIYSTCEQYRQKRPIPVNGRLKDLLGVALGSARK